MLSPKRPAAESQLLDHLEPQVERLGIVLEPDGRPDDAGGIMNPASARAPGGELLVYPRCVAEGNISRVGTVRVRPDTSPFETERLDYALVPQADYEIRPHPGYGCEDPRVTFVPVLGA